MTSPPPGPRTQSRVATGDERSELALDGDRRPGALVSIRKLNFILKLRLLLLLSVVCGSPVAHADHRVLWLKDLYRGDQIRVRPFGQHGRPRRREWLELSRFFRDRKGRQHPVAPGLLRVLAQVQRHFGRRQLHLMSGYRAPADSQALSSYHQVGHAADLSIEGVANRELFEYCRLLQRDGEQLGCGLYPRGAHVHIDVRSRATIWVDLSGYGDGAVYVDDPARWLMEHP